MVVPPDLDAKLAESLRVYLALKAKFDKKFKEVPFQVIKLYNYEEMQRLKRYASNDQFIEKAYLLGFRQIAGSYKGFPKQEITVFGQAVDYVNLFFCFDDKFHEIVTACLRTPIDTLDYLLNQEKFSKPPRRSRTLKYYYDYMEHLGE